MWYCVIIFKAFFDLQETSGHIRVTCACHIDGRISGQKFGDIDWEKPEEKETDHEIYIVRDWDWSG